MWDVVGAELGKESTASSLFILLAFPVSGDFLQGMEHSFKFNLWEVCTNSIKSLQTGTCHWPSCIFALYKKKKKKQCYFWSSLSEPSVGSRTMWDLPSCVSPVTLSPPSWEAKVSSGCPPRMSSSEGTWRSCWDLWESAQSTSYSSIPFPLTGKGTPDRKVSLAWKDITPVFNSWAPVAGNPSRAVFTFQILQFFL